MTTKVIKPIKTHNIGTRLQGRQAGRSCSKSFKKLIIIGPNGIFYHIDFCIAITACDTDEVLQFKITLEWLMNKVRALQRLKGWCDVTRNYTNIWQLPTVHNFLSHNNDVILSATLSFRSITYRSVDKASVPQ